MGWLFEAERWSLNCAALRFDVGRAIKWKLSRGACVEAGTTGVLNQTALGGASGERRLMARPACVAAVCNGRIQTGRHKTRIDWRISRVDDLGEQRGDGARCERLSRHDPRRRRLPPPGPILGSCSAITTIHSIHNTHMLKSVTTHCIIHETEERKKTMYQCREAITPLRRTPTMVVVSTAGTKAHPHQYSLFGLQKPGMLSRCIVPPPESRALCSASLLDHV